MPTCDICYEYIKCDGLLQKECCVYNICIKCYLQYNDNSCMFCKRKINNSSIKITPKYFFKNVLSLNIPRCPCVVKSGNRKGLSCLNNIYPPFKTCITHLENKPMNYKSHGLNLVRYIIHGIKYRSYNIKLYLATLYYFNKYYDYNNDYLANQSHFNYHKISTFMGRNALPINVIYEETKDDIKPFEEINTLS